MPAIHPLSLRHLPPKIPRHQATKITTWGDVDVRSRLHAVAEQGFETTVWS
jgi:hypothetical protein